MERRIALPRPLTLPLWDRYVKCNFAVKGCQASNGGSSPGGPGALATDQDCRDLGHVGIAATDLPEGGRFLPKPLRSDRCCRCTARSGGRLDNRTVIPGWSDGPVPASRDSGFASEPVSGPRFARTLAP